MGWETPEFSMTEGLVGYWFHISCHAEKKPLMQMRFSLLTPLNFRLAQSRIQCLVSGERCREESTRSHQWSSVFLIYLITEEHFSAWVNFMMLKKPSSPREWLVFMAFADTHSGGFSSEVVQEEVLDPLAEADVIVVDVKYL